MVDVTINTSPRTIRLKGVGTRLERVAGGTIVPGALVKLTSTNTLIAQSGVATRVPATFCVENELFGKGIDDNYVVNDYAQAETFDAGDEVLGYVAAAAAAIVEGDLLCSAGDGSVKLASTNPSNAVGIAMAAVDNSGGGAIARIQIKVI